MAQTPDKVQVKQAIAQTKKKITDKRSKQKALGKEFVVNLDGHGAGVVPEAVWKLRKGSHNG